MPQQAHSTPSRLGTVASINKNAKEPEMENDAAALGKQFSSF